MSKGKRFGYFVLGLSPVAVVLIWQCIATIIALFVYTAMSAPLFESLEVGSDAYYQAMDEISLSFTSGMPMQVTTFIIYIGYLLIFGLWYYFMYCRNAWTGSWKQVLNLKRILCIAAAGILIQLGMDMILTVTLPLFPNIYDSYMGVVDSLINNSIYMILCVCILAPIGEELIFRGLVFRTLKRAVPWQAALVIQAVLFGIYHLNLVQGIYTAVLGLCMGYLAYKYGSIIPGILLHIAINASSYLIGFLLPEALMEHTIIMIFVAVISLVGVIFLLGTVGRGVSDSAIVREDNSTSSNP